MREHTTTSRCTHNAYLYLLSFWNYTSFSLYNEAHWPTNYTPGPIFGFIYETIRYQDCFFRNQTIPGGPKGADPRFVAGDKTDLNSTTALLDKKVKIYSRKEIQTIQTFS